MFLVCSFEALHPCGGMSSGLGRRLSSAMLALCVAASVSRPMSARSSSSSRSRRIGPRQTSLRAGTPPRLICCPWYGTIAGPASAAWIFSAGVSSRTGPRTSMSASRISTPRLRELRTGRPSAKRSSVGRSRGVGHGFGILRIAAMASRSLPPARNPRRSAEEVRFYENGGERSNTAYGYVARRALA
jgi:hypothetical protein